MASLPSALCIGWAPLSLRSISESLRWARPTRPFSAIQVPAPSGPRAAIWSRMAVNSFSATPGAEAPYAKIPAMPHMTGASDLLHPGDQEAAHAPAVQQQPAQAVGNDFFQRRFE